MFTAGQGPVFAPARQGTGQTVPAVCAMPTLLEWGWLPPNPESQPRSCPGNGLPEGWAPDVLPGPQSPKGIHPRASENTFLYVIVMGSSILLPIYCLRKIFVTREEPGGPGERLSCAMERLLSSACWSEGVGKRQGSFSGGFRRFVCKLCSLKASPICCTDRAEVLRLLAQPPLGLCPTSPQDALPSIPVVLLATSPSKRGTCKRKPPETLWFHRVVQA